MSISSVFVLVARSKNLHRLHGSQPWCTSHWFSTHSGHRLWCKLACHPVHSFIAQVFMCQVFNGLSASCLRNSKIQTEVKKNYMIFFFDSSPLDLLEWLGRH